MREDLRRRGTRRAMSCAMVTVGCDMSGQVSLKERVPAVNNFVLVTSYKTITRESWNWFPL